MGSPDGVPTVGIGLSAVAIDAFVSAARGTRAGGFSLTRSFVVFLSNYGYPREFYAHLIASGMPLVCNVIRKGLQTVRRKLPKNRGTDI